MLLAGLFFDGLLAVVTSSPETVETCRDTTLPVDPRFSSTRNPQSVNFVRDYHMRTTRATCPPLQILAGTDARGFNSYLDATEFTSPEVGQPQDALESVIEMIRMWHNRRDGGIKYFIADASESVHDLGRTAESLRT